MLSGLAHRSASALEAAGLPALALEAQLLLEAWLLAAAADQGGAAMETASSRIMRARQTELAAACLLRTALGA